MSWQPAPVGQWCLFSRMFPVHGTAKESKKSQPASLPGCHASSLQWAQVIPPSQIWSKVKRKEKKPQLTMDGPFDPQHHSHQSASHVDFSANPFSLANGQKPENDTLYWELLPQTTAVLVWGQRALGCFEVADCNAVQWVGERLGTAFLLRVCSFAILLLLSPLSIVGLMPPFLVSPMAWCGVVWLFVV